MNANNFFYRLKISYKLLFRLFSFAPKMAFVKQKHAYLLEATCAITGAIIWSPFFLMLFILNYLWIPFKPILGAIKMTEKQQKQIEDFLIK